MLAGKKMNDILSIFPEFRARMVGSIFSHCLENPKPIIYNNIYYNIKNNGSWVKTRFFSKKHHLIEISPYIPCIDLQSPSTLKFLPDPPPFHQFLGQFLDLQVSRSLRNHGQKPIGFLRVTGFLYGLRDFSTGKKKPIHVGATFKIWLYYGFCIPVSLISMLFCHKKASVSIMFKETQPAPNQVR